MYQQKTDGAAILLANLSCIGIAIMPAALYRFSVSLIGLNSLTERISVFINYLLSICFIVFMMRGLYVQEVYLYTWGYYAKSSLIMTLFIIYLEFTILRVLVKVFRRYRDKSSSLSLLDRNRLRFVFFSILIGSPAPLDYLANYGINWYPFGGVFAILFVSGIVYAIVKHQLLDIQVIIKKTLVFAGLFAASYAVISIFAYLGSILFENFIQNKWIAMIPSVFIIVLMLRPLENYLKTTTDRFLFQKKYDYRNLLKTFTREVLTLLDVSELVELTVTKLTEIIKLNNASLLLFDITTDNFVLAASSGDTRASSCVIKNDENLWTFMLSPDQYIMLGANSENRENIPENLLKEIECLDTHLLIPLIHNNEVLGLLSLGAKKSDEEFTQDDIDILLPLASTISIALSNAKLVGQVSEAQAQAAQREKMAVIGTLSAGINHEICNPLGIIRGQCEMFVLNNKEGLYKDKTSDELLEKAQTIMEKVINEADRASSITRKLSAFAKPAKGEIDDKVEVEKEIDEVIALIEHELKLDNINITKSIPGDIPNISADRKQIQEIFFNLIRNAAHAITGEGHISIMAKYNSGKIYVDVRDNGSGIEKHRLKQIFDPFFTTKDPGKGTGLGLFIVKQVVEKNNGQISVESESGKGTVFHLVFKAAEKSDRVNIV